MDRHLTVLVVEDNWMIRDALEQIVESWLNVDLLSCGGFLEAATRIHKADHIDLLISDFSLGGEMTGIDVAEIAVKTFPDIAIVMVSGHQSSEIAGLIERYSYLQKPVGRDQLIEHIDSVHSVLKVGMRAGAKAFV